MQTLRLAKMHARFSERLVPVDPSAPDGLCAPGPQEHSLCGWAPEAFESGDASAPVVFAQAGELVTCKACRALLDYCRACFTPSYRYRG